ncbi:DUF4188 domain-containing protein [Streptomyces sp. NPDC052023]|uniref:DUF4188 domain-containing protein n=1 Tax=Streptomyces sp. NPDC052023 TaxID=3365681 RepID=UPI0037D8FF7B
MGARVVAGRQTAAGEGDIVVFHLGMRINSPWAVHIWLPMIRSMLRMLKELSEDPDSGLLGYRSVFSGPRNLQTVQYWSSTDQLLRYGSDPSRTHRPAWAEYNRRRRAGGRHVGVWHETYAVPPGGQESIYVDMPPYGLAAATGVVPVSRRGNRAAARLRSGAA